MRLAGGMQERKAAEHAIPTQVLSYSTSENSTCSMTALAIAVSPAPVVLDKAQGWRLLGASVVCHKDQSRAASAPDGGAWLAAPRAERGGDQMLSETSTAGRGMCVCVYDRA